MGTYQTLSILRRNCNSSDANGHGTDGYGNGMDEYTDGWLNAYHDSIHHVPLDFRTKPYSDMYNRGNTDGWNTGFPIGKVKDIRYIDGWLAGFGAQIHGLSHNTGTYNKLY